MPSVFRLAYVDLTTPSLDATRAYYRDVIGLAEVESGGGSSYMSLGLDHHTLALHEGGRPSLGAIGLQIGEVPIADLARRLGDMGIEARAMSDARPGVPQLLEVAGIGGHTFQLFPEIAASGRGFVGTGIAPLRLGHLAVLTPDAPKLLDFLRDGLGFWTTDWFEDFVTFVTCNHDHHVMNVISAPIATLHHLAFQLNDSSHQVRAADLLARHETATLWGPARHTAGHNIASYHYGADGALIELYNDMDVFVPELNACEPRPWHGDQPQRPKHWPLTSLTRWNTRYEFDMAAAAFGMPG